MTERRALQICPSDHPPFRDLCRAHARAMVCAGYDVDTVFLSPPVGAPDPEATYLTIAGGTVAGGRTSVRQMKRALVVHIAGRQFALTIAHRYRACRVAVSARRAVPLGRILAVAHEYDYFKRMQRRLWQRVMARDVTFAGVSPSVADQMRAQHAALANVGVIPNALDLESFDAALLDRDAARRSLGLPPDAYLIAVVGRLHPTKQPLLALQGFADAVEALPRRAYLVFVGDGAERGALERQIVFSQLESRVILLGHIENAPRFFAAFDLLLAAPRYDEAFGMVLLEGMAARVPILCADVPGPRSVLGEDGVYFSDVHDLAAKLIDATTTGIAQQRARLEAHFSDASLARWYLDTALTGRRSMRGHQNLLG